MQHLTIEEAARLRQLDEDLRAQANQMLSVSGLGRIIADAGYQATGSYAMRTMTWLDLDFERAQEAPDWADHWTVGGKLAATGWPWRQVCTDHYRHPWRPEKGLYWGLRVAPPGGGETWKLDLWTARAAEWAHVTAPRHRWQEQMTEEQRIHILAIKSAVWDRPEYRDTMLAVHIYEAVIDCGIRGLDAFMDWWRSRDEKTRRD